MKLFKLASLAIIFGLSTATVANAQVTTNPPTSNGIGNSLNYPVGTRVYSNGVISAPNGGITNPSVAVPRGDGSMTYYYQNGTSITIQPNQSNPTGTYIYPGANGGLTNNIYLYPQYIPNGANQR